MGKARRSGKRRVAKREVRRWRVASAALVVALVLSLLAGPDFLESAALRVKGLAAGAVDVASDVAAGGFGADVAGGSAADDGVAGERSLEPTAWNERESPNYVRLAGPAVIERELAPGEVEYEGLDALGRAGRVRACVTHDMVEAGSARERSSRLPDPSGWGHNEEVSIELPGGGTYNGWFWNRSHLLAKSLGGSDALDNLVCGTRMQNVGANDGQGGMALLETACRDWLDAYPEVTIQYVATPVYVGSELVPRSVFVDVKSSDGAIDECVEVYNAAKGYSIDYATGEFSR